MAQRHQRGWLKKEKRAQGETWVLFFRTTRKSDGKRVENKIPVGLLRDLPDASSAWAEVERLHAPINPRRCATRIELWGLGTALCGTRVGCVLRIDPPQDAYNHKRLRASSPKPAAPTNGEQNRTWHRTVGGGTVAKGFEKGRRSCQSDARQDSSRHVLGV